MDGVWYFKAQPDVVTVVGLKGKVLGELKLNEQSKLKLETEVTNNESGMSVGVGFGPVGIAAGGTSETARFMTFNMGKTQAKFAKQQESREEKIKREYEERKRQKQEEKELAKQAKKDKRKNK